MKTVEEVIQLARSYADDDNARLCVRDAEIVIHWPNEHAREYARDRALKSLAYSVGVFHPVYQACVGST